MKRVEREEIEDFSSSKQRDPTKSRVETSELVFEDPFEDSFESDSMEGMKEEEENDQEDDDEMAREGQSTTMDDEEDEEEREVWLPSLQPLQDGEKLEYDPGAYDMIHFITPEWPCLSFDILPDNLGTQREKFPHTMYLVAGTQAEDPSDNKIILMKLSDLAKTKEDSDPDDGFNLSSSSSAGDEDPIMETRIIKHAAGTVNRIRAMPQQSHVIACMNENSSVQIYDVKPHLAALDKPPAQKLKPAQPAYTFKGHPTEGYGIAWNPKVEGRMITSDCAKNIFWWDPVQGGKWSVDLDPFSSHTASVEDLQWSPSEPDVFASCSVDKTIKLWDSRKGKSCVATILAHDSDVNVISWNAKRAFLILSGSNAGDFKVWDLRKLKEQDMKANFTFAWHSKAITSVEWSPHDDSTLCVSSADDSVSIWDLSLTTEKTKIKGVDIPSQLLFVHHGQELIKEVHWHKQIPGALVSTALDGFNVFKPFNI